MQPRETRPIDELIFEIFRVNARLLEAGDEAVKDTGLTSARWQVLGAVALAPTAPTVAEIARNMGLTRQAVQRLANEMVASKLLELKANPRHQRSRLMILTAEGQTAYDEALHRWRRDWTAAMEEILTESEITETMRRLRRLRGLLQSTA
jgi:DNA-binding MarR family transcriptional regulator